MISETIKIRYTAHGCDWWAKGVLHGTWEQFETLGRVFEEMEERHQKSLEAGK
jgi:hypothetical protein